MISARLTQGEKRSRAPGRNRLQKARLALRMQIGGKMLKKSTVSTLLAATALAADMSAMPSRRTRMPKITRRKFVGMGAGLALVTSAAPYAQVARPAASFPRPSRAARALMRDAIDIHIHLDPDSFGPHSNQTTRALDV